MFTDIEPFVETLSFPKPDTPSTPDWSPPYIFTHLVPVHNC